MAGLHIREIKETLLNSKIYCDSEVSTGILSMTSFLPEIPLTSDENCISLVYHNIQGLQNHMKDLKTILTL